MWRKKRFKKIQNLVAKTSLIIFNTAAAAAKSLQLCPILCDPTDGSPPGSPVPGILQEHWSELPFPSPMHESEKWKSSHSVVSDSSQPHGLQPTRLLCPFSRQEYWSGLPLPSLDYRLGLAKMCIMSPNCSLFSVVRTFEIYSLSYF